MKLNLKKHNSRYYYFVMKEMKTNIYTAVKKKSLLPTISWKLIYIVD